MVSRTGDLLNRLREGTALWWWSFKYSDIRREKGTYRAGPPGYRPYLARHEPPLATASNRRARIVYDRVMAVKDERVAEISRVLAQAVREPVPAPEFWDSVGNWMIETVEGSRERGSDRYRPYLRDYAGSGLPPTQVGGESTTVLRPLWESIVLDLSFLLGEHMITHLKTACWGFDGDWRAGSCSGAPRVIGMIAERRSDDIPPMEMPFRSITKAAQYCLVRRQGLFGKKLEPFRLGNDLRRIINTDDWPKPYNAREEFIASLEEYLAENGDLPPNDDIVQWMVEAGLLYVPELPSRLESILDERDRREGRTGNASWRAAVKA